MTRDEREYFYKRLEDLFGKWASAITKKDLGAGMLNTFAERHMQAITGQQPLPQATFREFLSEFDYPLASDVATLMSDVATNKVDIATNKVDIATNKVDITTLQTDKLDKTSALLETSTTDIVGAINEVNTKLGSNYNLYQGGNIDFNIYLSTIPAPQILVECLPAGTYTIDAITTTTLTGGVDEQYMKACVIEYDDYFLYNRRLPKLDEYIDYKIAIDCVHSFGETFTTTKDTTLLVYPCVKPMFLDILMQPAGGFLNTSYEPTVTSKLSLASISVLNSGTDVLFKYIVDLCKNVKALQTQVDKLSKYHP